MVSQVMYNNVNNHVDVGLMLSKFCAVESTDSHPGQVLQLSEDDVEINYRSPLGSGGFCTVYPVKIQNRPSLGTLALKKLRLAIVQNKQLCKVAAADLAREAKLLAELSHENIIELYGVRKQEDKNTDPASFFMVMDVLSDTLDSRFETWVKNRGRFKQTVPHDTVIRRVSHVALGIAKGMEYLHSKQIIFRYVPFTFQILTLAWISNI